MEGNGAIVRECRGSEIVQSVTSLWIRMGKPRLRSISISNKRTKISNFTKKTSIFKVKTKLTWFRKCFQIVLKVQRINMNRFHILFCIACCKDNSIMLQSTLSYCYNHFLLHNASRNYNIHCWGFKIKPYWKLEQYSRNFTFQVKNLSFELKLICNVTVYSFHHASIM